MTNPQGRFGDHGGQYIPETLMNAVIELEEAYNRLKDDPDFKAELRTYLNDYANRPSLLYFAQRMTKDLGGAKIYLKREDLNHTGAHKINNALGQALLAKRMGKTRLIAETGAGQHGVATATVAALLGMECHVYMGVEDIERQALNVYRMRLLGTEVHGVDSGTGTLKDAVSECMREWTKRIDDTHYLLGSCMGPHPFPTIVRDFQAFIGQEIADQCLELEGRLPDYVVACVGGGSNAIGSFHHFIEHPEFAGLEFFLRHGDVQNDRIHAAVFQLRQRRVVIGTNHQLFECAPQIFAFTAGRQHLDYRSVRLHRHHVSGQVGNGLKHGVLSQQHRLAVVHVRLAPNVIVFASVDGKPAPNTVDRAVFQLDVLIIPFYRHQHQLPMIATSDLAGKIEIKADIFAVLNIPVRRKIGIESDLETDFRRLRTSAKPQYRGRK